MFTPSYSVSVQCDEIIMIPLQERTIEKENTQGSLLGLLGAVAFVFIVANFAKVFGYLQRLLVPRGGSGISPSMGRRR